LKAYQKPLLMALSGKQRGQQLFLNTTEQQLPKCRGSSSFACLPLTC